jgi:hypothetical protein
LLPALWSLGVITKRDAVGFIVWTAYQASRNTNRMYTGLLAGESETIPSATNLVHVFSNINARHEVIQDESGDEPLSIHPPRVAL